MSHDMHPALAYVSCSEGVFAFEARAAAPVREALLGLGLSKPVLARLFAEKRLELLPAAEAQGPARAFANPASVAAPGDRVLVRASRLDPPGCLQAAPLHVLYEDPFVLAVNKPAGLLVHGDGTGAATLSDHVAAYLHERGEHFVLQAVQRLDVETTGVVLFSKTAEFQPLFDALVAGHDMQKRYLAVVHGAFPGNLAAIDAPIARDRHDARRMRVADRGGQEAHTKVELLAVNQKARVSLLRVGLGTGRKHQIRVHLASCGHPIVGDPLYGSAADKPRELMLHAYEERFEHPVTGEPVCACAGWPQRFSAWFDASDLRDLSER